VEHLHLRRFDRTARARRLKYAAGRPKRLVVSVRVSDHCPIAVVFESDEPVEPADAMAVLLDRLVAVQTKLEDIRAGVAALRE
jgi:hypothetical protein